MEEETTIMVSNPAVEEGRVEAAIATPGTAAPPDESLFTALIRYPQFRFLWSASLSTQLGQWFQNVALGWLALELTNSAGFVGKIGFASGVPILLLSLPAGVLLDRIDRRRALMVCQVVGAILALVVAFVNWRGLIEPWHLVLAAVVSGALLASIAGLLIGAVGLAGCFVAQSGALLGAAALTAFIRMPQGARAGAAIGGGLIEGLRLIRRDRTLTGLLLLGAAPALLAYPYIQMLPVFVRDVLHLDARGLGLIMAASGVGGLSGSLFVAKLNRYPHKGRLTVIMGVIYGFVLIAFTISPWPVLSAVVLAASTFVGSAFYSGNQILVQTHVSEAIRGRVMGALALSFGLTPVGSLLIGELAQSFGAPLGVALGALGSSLCVALIGWRYREILSL